MPYEFNPQKSLEMAQNLDLENEKKNSMKQLNLFEIKNFVTTNKDKLMEKAINYGNEKKQFY